VKKFAPILIATALLVTMAAHSRDWVTDNSFGVAPVSCADWIAHRKLGPQRWETDAWWMFGFLTALVRAKGYTPGGGMTAEDFPGEIDGLCAAHPEADAPAILEVFAIRHKLIAPSAQDRIDERAWFAISSVL
jgi:hypothetical protein